MNAEFLYTKKVEAELELIEARNYLDIYNNCKFLRDFIKDEAKQDIERNEQTIGIVAQEIKQLLPISKQMELGIYISVLNEFIEDNFIELTGVNCINCANLTELENMFPCMEKHNFESLPLCPDYSPYNEEVDCKYIEFVKKNLADLTKIKQQKQTELEFLLEDESYRRRK